MRAIILIAALALTACSPQSVYDLPIPDRDDTKAQLKIRDGLKPEDQEAWVSLLRQQSSPTEPKVVSKTVSEAVARFNERAACLEKHHSKNRPTNPLPQDHPDYDAAESKRIEENNREVAAYNACLELPL